MKNKVLSIIGVMALAVFALTSCKKEYLDTKPSQSTSGEVLFESTKGGYIALNGLHSLMLTEKLFGGNHRDFGAKAGDLGSDLMGNDMVSSEAGGYDWFFPYYNFQAAREPTNAGYIIWQFQYRIINNANNIIGQIDDAAGDQLEKNDIKGQALAYRAWSYLRLIQRFSKTYAYGANASAPGVPIYTAVTGGSDEGNARGTIQDVVDRMSQDINDAITLLSDAVVHEDKANITLQVAHGIAARIAMYKGDWPAAQSHAKAAQSGFSFMSAAEFTKGMNNRSNPEFMWCSTYTATQYNDLGIVCWISFFDESTPGYAGLTAVERKVTKQMYDLISGTDSRKGWFKADLFQRKFRTADPEGFVCDVLYMRLPEMYLIEAEAAAEQGNIPLATTIMTSYLSSRNAVGTLPTTKEEMLTKIRWERRVELWGEGFAFTDLKERNLPLTRPLGTGNHDKAVCTEDFLAPGDNKWTFKIPLAEINANPKIGAGDQNP